MHKKNSLFRTLLPDALLCAGAVCLVAGVTLLLGVPHGLLCAGGLSVCYGVLAARSGGEDG